MLQPTVEDQEIAEKPPIPSIFASISREPCTHTEFLEVTSFDSLDLASQFSPLRSLEIGNKPMIALSRARCRH